MLRPLCLLLLVLAAAPAVTTAEERPLRLVSFNVLHGGPWAAFTGDDARLDERLRMVVEQLRALDADVIALQESPITRRRGDVAARMAAALGLYHVHARATERVFPVRVVGRLVTAMLGFVEGPAVLSRFPIAATEIYDLPRCQRRLDPRVALRADVRTPAGLLSVFSTHVSRDDCQTRRVAELVAEHARASVVMGDLNVVDSAPGFEAFRQHGFVDAFRAANPTAAGATVWQRVEAPEPTVFRRVDYVLLRAGDDVAVEIVSSRVVLNTPRRDDSGGTLWPSDHYGVLAEIRLAPAGSLRPASDR